MLNAASSPGTSASERSNAVDRLLESHTAPGRPGLNLAVVEGGRIVHQGGYGLASVEDAVPFTPDTLLHLGSVTKHFCATCVLILENRGLLTLSNSVRRHVPELPAFMEAVSLRHLLTMTSGLPDGLNLSLFSGGMGTGVTQAAHFDILQRLAEPMFSPGGGTTYSNSNYLLVSMVVERLSGMSLADFMQRELFEPLGMASTRLLRDPSLAAPNKARGYAVGADGVVRSQAPVMDLCGDGGIATTLRDLIAWAANYADDRLVGPDYRARMEAEALLNDGTPTGYGLGMAVSPRKVSHGGGMPGYMADFAFYPGADLFVLWLANHSDPALFGKTDEIAAFFTQTEVSPPSPSNDLREKVGTIYLNHSLGCTAEFEATPEGVALHLMGERLLLEPSGPSEYRPTKATAFYPLRLTRDGVEIRLGTTDWAKFIPFDSADAEAVVLADYCGAYDCELLGETHYIRLGDGTLEVTLGSAVRELIWKDLKPRGGELFSAVIPGEPNDTDVSLLFQRDADGQVSGLRYNLSRTRGVEFTRRRGA